MDELTTFRADATVYCWSATNATGARFTGADVVCGRCKTKVEAVVDYSRCAQREPSMELDGTLEIESATRNRHRRVRCSMCGAVVLEQQA